jgi:hypothetical protein
MEVLSIEQILAQAKSFNSFLSIASLQKEKKLLLALDHC